MLILLYSYSSDSNKKFYLLNDREFGEVSESLMLGWKVFRLCRFGGARVRALGLATIGGDTQFTLFIAHQCHYCDYDCYCDKD